MWPPKNTILRDGKPYLHRYYLLGTGKTVGVFLHHLVASDSKTALHDHPWSWAVSLVLSGGYREHRLRSDGHMMERWVGPLSFNVLRSHDRHRVELREGRGAWTLFLHGRVVKPWSFF
jgi:hypothetical protein